MTSAPTAAWPTYALRDALARAAWGPLDGRGGGGLRGCLNALVAMADWKSGRARITATQVARAAGMSERWARRCLAMLEDLGLIVWSRGWLDNGNPRPGHVVIVKRALARMAREARRRATDLADASRAAARERIQRLRKPGATIPPRAKHVATRPELYADHTPLKGVDPTGHHPQRDDNMPKPKAYTPLTPACVHGVPVYYGAKCDACDIDKHTSQRRPMPAGWADRVRDQLHRQPTEQPPLL